MKKIPLLICLLTLFSSGLSAQNLPARKTRSLVQDRMLAPHITLGTRFIVDSAVDGGERQFPFAYKFGNNILISYSEHKDAVMGAPVDAMMVSRDNGKTRKGKLTNKDFYISSMVEKKASCMGWYILPILFPPDRRKWFTGHRKIWAGPGRNMKVW